MNRNLKMITHLIGIASSYFIGYYLLNLNSKTGFAIITGMLIGYLFCFIANRSN